jgi:hypothetical protein
MISDSSIACKAGCGRVARTRGLCPGHYATACKLVREGKATWAALEAEDRAGPAKPRNKVWGSQWEGKKK